jgi:hypothetical protein
MKLVPIALVALSMGLPSCVHSSHPGLEFIIKDRNGKAIPNVEITAASNLLLLDGSFPPGHTPVEEMDYFPPGHTPVEEMDYVSATEAELASQLQARQRIQALRKERRKRAHEKFPDLLHRATLLTDAEGRAWIMWNPPKPNSFLRNLATLWRDPKVGTVVIEYTTPDGTRTRQEIYVNSWRSDRDGHGVAQRKREGYERIEAAKKKAGK